MRNTKCKNCGGDEALHHYQTNQCPRNGTEAPIGRKQEWMSTTFDPDRVDEIAELRGLVKELQERVKAIEEKAQR